MVRWGCEILHRADLNSCRKVIRKGQPIRYQPAMHVPSFVLRLQSQDGAPNQAYRQFRNYSMSEFASIHHNVHSIGIACLSSYVFSTTSSVKGQCSAYLRGHRKEDEQPCTVRLLLARSATPLQVATQWGITSSAKDLNQVQVSSAQGRFAQQDKSHALILLFTYWLMISLFGSVDFTFFGSGLPAGVDVASTFPLLPFTLLGRGLSTPSYVGAIGKS